MDNDFIYQPPTAPEVPVIVSSPHSGTEIPNSIKIQMCAAAHSSPDADHFVNELYKFAPKIGCHFMAAKYSRYVIDLNRAPDSQPLYDDGRQITGLVPLKMFDSQPIYLKSEPTAEAIRDRIDRYYQPYHRQIERLIEGCLNRFGVALLFDCHSINRTVPSIRKKPFPDMILGNQDQTSSHPGLFQKAQAGFGRYGHKVADNHPFKGGHITRYYGNPSQGVHTLQLEMSKDLYMNEAELSRNPVKGGLISGLLRETLVELAHYTAQTIGPSTSNDS